MIVAKFGGSSMADSVAMRRSAKVAAAQDSLAIVLVSATYGTTNELVSLAQVARDESWDKCAPLVKKIKDKHIKIAEELNCSPAELKKLEALLKEIKTLARGINYLKDCSGRAYDSLLSTGERLSSLLFSKALQDEMKSDVEWFDIRKVLITDDQFQRALPKLDLIEKYCQEELLPLLKKNKTLVSQGFIGSTEDGLTTTLGRGGSDYSAALIAEGITATTLQIWTDVAGVATTDPRICPNAQPLKELSFTEAAELATFGAKILHPTTVWPAMRKNIPVFVGSSIEPQKEGTWIRPISKEAPLVRAIALRKNQSILTITTPRMVQAWGYLADIFAVFKKHRVSVDLITTSEISVAITVNDDTLENKNLIEELKSMGQVKIENGFSLISIIGNNINHTSGLGNDILTIIKDINIRLVCCGASKHNFCFLVDKKQDHEATQRLHTRFLE